MSLHDELLILVPWLRAHPSATVPEVAAHFGVSEREVRQYILLLGITGYGQLHGELIDINYDGDHINLYDTLGLDRPYRFDTMQATCLLAGLDAQRLLPAATRGFSDAELDSAYQKIASTLHRHIRFDFVSPAEEQLQESLAVIATALTEGKQVDFEYWNNARDGLEQRRVSPWRLRTEDGEVLLDGYCHTRGGWRTFRADRIRAAAIRAQAAELPALDFEPMPTELVEISVPRSRKHLLEQFDLASAPILQAERWHAQIEVALPEWLARRVLASALDVQVHAPASVAERVAGLLQLARAPYLPR